MGDIYTTTLSPLWREATPSYIPGAPQSLIEVFASSPHPADEKRNTCATPRREHPPANICGGPKSRRSRRGPPPKRSDKSGAALSLYSRFNERHTATPKTRLHSPLAARHVRGAGQEVRARRRLLHEFVIVAVRQVGRRRLFIARDGVLHGPRRCAVPLAGHVAVSVELLDPQMPQPCVPKEVLLATVSPTPGQIRPV